MRLHELRFRSRLVRDVVATSLLGDTGEELHLALHVPLEVVDVRGERSVRNGDDAGTVACLVCLNHLTVTSRRELVHLLLVEVTLLRLVFAIEPLDVIEAHRGDEVDGTGGIVPDLDIGDAEGTVGIEIEGEEDEGEATHAVIGPLLLDQIFLLLTVHHGPLVEDTVLLVLHVPEFVDEHSCFDVVCIGGVVTGVHTARFVERALVIDPPGGFDAIDDGAVVTGIRLHLVERTEDLVADPAGFVDMGGIWIHEEMAGRDTNGKRVLLGDPLVRLVGSRVVFACLLFTQQLGQHGIHVEHIHLVQSGGCLLREVVHAGLVADFHHAEAEEGIHDDPAKLVVELDLFELVLQELLPGLGLLVLHRHHLDALRPHGLVARGEARGDNHRRVAEEDGGKDVPDEGEVIVDVDGEPGGCRLLGLRLHAVLVEVVVVVGQDVVHAALCTGEDLSPVSVGPLCSYYHADNPLPSFRSICCSNHSYEPGTTCFCFSSSAGKMSWGA